MDALVPENDRELAVLRELAQAIVSGNGDLSDLKAKASALAERYLALHDRLVSVDGGAFAVIPLSAGDPLPQGARFCQIIGSKDEPIGPGPRTRRVYLVLVEHAGRKAG